MPLKVPPPPPLRPRKKSIAALGSVADGFGADGRRLKPRPPRPTTAWPPSSVKRRRAAQLAPPVDGRKDLHSLGALMAAVPQLSRYTPDGVDGRALLAPSAGAGAIPHGPRPDAPCGARPPPGRLHPRRFKMMRARAMRSLPGDGQQRKFQMHASAMLEAVGARGAGTSVAAPPSGRGGRRRTPHPLDPHSTALLLTHYSVARVVHAGLVERLGTLLAAGAATVAQPKLLVLGVTALGRLGGAKAAVSTLLSRLAEVWEGEVRRKVADRQGREREQRKPTTGDTADRADDMSLAVEGIGLGLWSLSEAIDSADLLHLLAMLVPTLVAGCSGGDGHGAIDGRSQTVALTPVIPADDAARILCLFARLLPTTGGAVFTRLWEALVSVDYTRLTASLRPSLLWAMGQMVLHRRGGEVDGGGPKTLPIYTAAATVASMSGGGGGGGVAAHLDTACDRYLSDDAFLEGAWRHYGAAARPLPHVLTAVERVLWAHHAAGRPLGDMSKRAVAALVLRCCLGAEANPISARAATMILNAAAAQALLPNAASDTEPRRRRAKSSGDQSMTATYISAFTRADAPSTFSAAVVQSLVDAVVRGAGAGAAEGVVEVPSAANNVEYASSEPMASAAVLPTASFAPGSPVGTAAPPSPAAHAVEALCILAKHGLAGSDTGGAWMPLYGAVLGVPLTALEAVVETRARAAAAAAGADAKEDEDACVVAVAPTEMPVEARRIEALANKEVDALSRENRLNVMWGLAKVHVPLAPLPGGPRLLNTLADIVGTGPPHDTVMAVWAAATFSVRRYAMYEHAVARLLAAGNHALNIAHLVSASWSLARVKVTRPGTDELPRLFRPLRSLPIPPEQAAALVWSQTALRCADPLVMDKIRDTVTLAELPEAERAYLRRAFRKMDDGNL